MFISLYDLNACFTNADLRCDPETKFRKMWFLGHSIWYGTRKTLVSRYQNNTAIQSQEIM